MLGLALAERLWTAAPLFAKRRKITPLWQRGVRGDFIVKVNSILRPLITYWFNGDLLAESF
jgi:hypothetical protein